MQVPGGAGCGGAQARTSPQWAGSGSPQPRDKRSSGTNGPTAPSGTHEPDPGMRQSTTCDTNAPCGETIVALRDLGSRIRVPGRPDPQRITSRRRRTRPTNPLPQYPCAVVGPLHGGRRPRTRCGCGRPHRWRGLCGTQKRLIPGIRRSGARHSQNGSGHGQKTASHVASVVRMFGAADQDAHFGAFARISSWHSVNRGAPRYGDDDRYSTG